MFCKTWEFIMPTIVHDTPTKNVKAVESGADPKKGKCGHWPPLEFQLFWKIFGF
jgi:hypothetical protein